MEANSKLPAVLNGKRNVVNASSLPALTSAAQMEAVRTANAMLLPKWRYALANAKCGLGNARILCIGDSTTWGGYALNNTTADVESYAYPKWLSDMFNASGVFAHRNSFMGNGGTGGTTLTYDSRVTAGSWTNSAVNTLAGHAIQVSSGSSPLIFAPTTPVDTFVIYYITNSGLGTFNANINGGSNTLINTNTTVGIQSTTISGTLGMNNCQLTWASGTSNLVGIEAYDSSKSWVSVINAGNSGSTSATWAVNSTAYSPAPAIAAMAANLNLVMLGINDWNQNLGVGQYYANMNTVLVQCVASGGDTAIVTPVPSLPSLGGVPIAQQLPYVQAMKKLASIYGLPIIDFWGRWQNAPSSFYASTGGGLHPIQTGYNDMSQTIFNVIGNP